MSNNILKVLVGSRAHGVADENSDYDYRGVFVQPTSEILSLFSKPKNTHWIEGDNDNTSWEIGHFLQMATKCNPTILEVFHAPVVDRTDLGDQLRKLFSSVWNTKDLINAHIGYGLNQRKKFLEDKDNRKSKYASAYLRALYQCYWLLTQNKYPVNMEHTDIFDTLKRYRKGEYEYGEVIDTCMGYQKKIESRNWQDKKTDIDKVNKFLLDIRKESLLKYSYEY
jgi:uncharacterized protein